MTDNKAYPPPTNPTAQPGYQAPPGYQASPGYQAPPGYQAAPPKGYQTPPPVPRPTGTSTSSVVVVQGRGAGTTVVQHSSTNYGGQQHQQQPIVVQHTKPAQPVKSQGGLFVSLAIPNNNYTLSICTPMLCRVILGKLLIRQLKT